MNILVCIGSSCHLRGSYDIIQRLKELSAQENWGDRVQLGASFCLGRCTDGVTIKVDDEIVTGVSPENFNEIFEQHVLKKLQ